MISQATIRLYDGYQHTAPDLRPLVLHAQKLLAGAGFQIRVDGLFGPSTQMAVEHFQRARGLDPDGLIGPRTWAALEGREATPTPAVLVSKVGMVAVYNTTYPADHDTLRKDRLWANEHRPLIERIAGDFGVPVALVAGIGSRESGWGRLLSPKGPGGKGDGGHGRGVMQIDDRSHQFARTGKWNVAADNITYGVSHLVIQFREMKRKTSLDGVALLRAAVAAYNCGAKNVLNAISRGRDVDYFTWQRNYSVDVLNRAGWFQREGW